MYGRQLRVFDIGDFSRQAAFSTLSKFALAPYCNERTITAFCLSCVVTIVIKLGMRVALSAPSIVKAAWLEVYRRGKTEGIEPS